jgi:hypothetical protein
MRLQAYGLTYLGPAGSTRGNFRAGDVSILE